MKNSVKFFTLCAMTMLICLSGCGEKKEAATAPQSGVLVQNVLSKELYDDCHIKGSVQVSVDELEKFVQNIDKNSDIVVYCSNYQCGSSEFVCQQLQSMGFVNVHAYEGGMAEWFQMGLPVEGPCQASYLKKTVAKPEAEHAQVPVIEAQELAKKLHINV